MHAALPGFIQHSGIEPAITSKRPWTMAPGANMAKGPKFTLLNPMFNDRFSATPTMPMTSMTMAQHLPPFLPQHRDPNEFSTTHAANACEPILRALMPRQTWVSAAHVGDAVDVAAIFSGTVFNPPHEQPQTTRTRHRKTRLHAPPHTARCRTRAPLALSTPPRLVTHSRLSGDSLPRVARLSQAEEFPD